MSSLTASNSPIYRICKHRSIQFRQHLSLGSTFEKSVLSLPVLFWACLIDGSWSSWKSLHSRFQSVLRQVSLAMSRQLFSFNRPSWEKRKRFFVESLPTYRLYLASRTFVTKQQFCSVERNKTIYFFKLKPTFRLTLFLQTILDWKKSKTKARLHSKALSIKWAFLLDNNQADKECLLVTYWTEKRQFYQHGQ